MSLVLKPINELLGKIFSIPSYQRGYRWKNTQVENLLDDILEFRVQSKKEKDKTKDVFYCLQPLIVSKKDNGYILIDGQQRLTTIYLILTYLGKTKYKIEYKTRKKSETFLKEVDQAVDQDKKFENIDYFYIAEAYKTIKNWFKAKGDSIKTGFAETLLNKGKNVQVIWYEIENENENEIAAEIFTRINAGKIPLTNAELIKALFLKKDNFESNEKDNIYLKQLEIASEWDRIESSLQDDKFWCFISTDSDKYDTRIEFIFYLMVNKKSSNEDYITFYEFQKKFKEKDINTIWDEVKQYFMTIEQWYNNREFYHLIGYLIHSKLNWKVQELKTLIKQAQLKTKTDFKECLKSLIENQLKEVVIDELEYGDEHLKDVLLLFNIQTIINNKSNIRFPFDEYKKMNWDIEHIRSIQSDKPDDLEKQKKWLNNVYEYYTGNSFCTNSLTKTKEESLNKITSLLLKIDKHTENNFTEEFNTVYELVLAKFKAQLESCDGL